MYDAAVSGTRRSILTIVLPVRSMPTPPCRRMRICPSGKTETVRLSTWLVALKVSTRVLAWLAVSPRLAATDAPVGVPTVRLCPVLRA